MVKSEKYCAQAHTGLGQQGHLAKVPGSVGEIHRIHYVIKNVIKNKNVGIPLD
jgi:hypothetical protein